MEYTKDKPLRVFEAFAGYGSQSLALKRLKEHYPQFDYVAVGFSEIEKSAIIAYQALHGYVKNYGDICTIDWEQVPDFDLFTYSFPCQDISAAGQQKGLKKGEGTRSGLLWECEKAIRIKRPKYLMLENVKALLSKKFINDYKDWVSLLASYGYETFTEIINAKNMGVPQNRERVFGISILKTEESPVPKFSFPKPFKLELRLKDVLEEKVDEKYYLSDKMLEYFNRVNDDQSHGHDFKPTDGGDFLRNKDCPRSESGRYVRKVGRVNESQDGVVVCADGIAQCHTAGHGNTPKILDETEDTASD